MSSLTACLATALSGLSAAQGSIETTDNNVSNANTPGYSREVPELVTSDPIVEDPLTFGTGVTLKNIESVRDPILESQIQQETQTQGQFDSLVSALSQTQVNFTSSSNDIGTAISNFFNSINSLSTSPADLSLRQGVLTAAQNLATAFNTAANNLSAQRSSLNGSVQGDVGQINELTSQIAQLNGQISTLQNSGENALTLVDQRTEAIDQLSALVDVSVIPADNSLTLTTANGTPLVLGQQSLSLSTETNAAGLEQIYDSEGNNITSTIVSGQLGGLLQARDQQIPSFESQLDTLAAGIANSVNAVQTNGYDLTGTVDENGNPVKSTNDLFTPPPQGTTGAAASMSVAITNPSLIAASGDGTSGSNANAEAMYALSSSTTITGLEGMDPTDYYSGIVFNVGNAASNANAGQTAANSSLQQLNDQRSSVSGVSLDEEAANLMQYQQAYQASAQVITTINDMMYTAINMTTLTG